MADHSLHRGTNSVQHFSALIACHGGQWSIQAAAQDGTGGSMLKQSPADSLDDAIERLRRFADDAERAIKRLMRDEPRGDTVEGEVAQ